MATSTLPVKLGRPLIDPSEPVNNDGYDNENFELIVHLNQRFTDDEGRTFIVKRKVGSGEFGHVYKAVLDIPNSPAFAMKVSKSDKASRDSLQYEASVFKYVRISYLYLNFCLILLI